MALERFKALGRRLTGREFPREMPTMRFRESITVPYTKTIVQGVEIYGVWRGCEQELRSHRVQPAQGIRLRIQGQKIQLV
jgi:hypothetical protein